MRLIHVLDFKQEPNEVVTVSPEASVREAVDLLCEHRIGALPVVDPETGVVLGIVTERDVLAKCCRSCTASADIPVSEIMTADVVTGNPTDRVVDTLRMMSEKRIRHVPLVDEGKLVGIVSIGDVLRALYQEDEIHLRRLAEYMGGTYRCKVY